MPQRFGFKTGWFALRADGPARVARVFGIESALSASWSHGLNHGDVPEGHVFLTPPVDGWCFIVDGGRSAPDPDNHGEDLARRLVRLSGEFGTVDYFVSHRVIDEYGCARAEGGVLRRICAIGFNWEEQPFVLRGSRTEAEIELGVPEWTELPTREASESYFDALDRAEDAAGTDHDVNRFEAELGEFSWGPDEGTVIDVASRWSIDPLSLDRLPSATPGVGLLGAFPG